MSPRISIIALLSVIVILSSGAEAQRQRGRGQYGRRREVAPVEEIEEAQPQPVYAVLEKTTERPKIYEIHREIAPNLGDGTFKYYSATSDGLESEQVGHFNNPYQSQIHQGSYTTKDEHGQVVKVDYIADKNGFRPAGLAAGVPVPPPVPLEHAKAREDILKLQAAIRDQHLGYLRAGYAAHGR